MSWWRLYICSSGLGICRMWREGRCWTLIAPLVHHRKGRVRRYRGVIEASAKVKIWWSMKRQPLQDVS
jgi:hypothetical protein